MAHNAMKYPFGKDFVFTVLDDTDVSTLGNVKPIYDFLTEIKLFTTKTVWPCSFRGDSDHAGSHTLEHRDYADYVREISDRGFEIAYHGASMESSLRDKIIQSFNIFYDVLGFYPRTYAAHAGNQDNLYWGSERFSSPLLKFLFSRFITKEKPGYYLGHAENSPFFWGDLAQSHICYTRNLTYNSLNILKISKDIVYKDKSKPLANILFITADAGNVEDFCSLVSHKNQEKLVKQRGICIISTHFGKGFVANGRVHPKVRMLLECISKRNGWFAPVGEVLDFISSQNNGITFISKQNLFRLEFKWLLHAIIRRVVSRDYQKTETPYLLASISEDSMQAKEDPVEKR